MSNGAFLLLALGLSVIGSMLIWLLNRKPKTFMSSIDDFSREMKALGHEPDGGPSVRRRRRTTTGPTRSTGSNGPNGSNGSNGSYGPPGSPIPPASPIVARSGEDRSPDATEERRP